MAILNINPYLNFDGTATQAIELYQRALGAKVEFLQRFGDVPNMPSPPELKDRVMHAQLQIGEGKLMISDTPPGDTIVGSGNSYIAIHFDDVADATARFEALAKGGQVTMALAETFWARRFGMLVDAFGTRWMFNCGPK